MVLLLINSCRKDRQNLPLTKTELITEARSFFENEVVNLPKLKDNNIRHSTNKTPLWDKASIRKISIGDAVIVPIKYDYDIFIKPEGDKILKNLGNSSYLMIYKNKQQELQVEWVTIIADKKNKGKNFVGTIAIEDWNGKFKRGFAFGADGNILPVYLNSADTYRKISFTRSIYCYTIEHYGYVMDYPQIIGVEVYCFGSGGGSGSGGNHGPEDDVEDDGNGTETNPTDYSYTIDCNEDINGTATWNEDCQTCIGGNTGINSCAEITEKIKNECLNGVWLSIKANLDDKIVSLLHTTFGQNHSINFKVVDGNVDSGAPAKSQVTKNSINSSGEIKFDVKVTLNKNTMPSYSKEFIASTIIHEIMHAYFNANKIHYNQQFQQHQSMAEGYVDSMKDAVQDIFPDLPDNSAYALILNGFNDMFENNLDGWNALLLKYQLSNQEIYDTQISYKSSAQGAPGTKCPPNHN